MVGTWLGEGGKHEGCLDTGPLIFLHSFWSVSSCLGSVLVFISNPSSRQHRIGEERAVPWCRRCSCGSGPAGTQHDACRGARSDPSEPRASSAAMKLREFASRWLRTCNKVERAPRWCPGLAWGKRLSFGRRWDAPLPA